MARASRCPSSMGGRGILPGRPRALASRSRQHVRAHAHAGTDTAAEAAGPELRGRARDGASRRSRIWRGICTEQRDDRRPQALAL